MKKIPNITIRDLFNRDEDCPICPKTLSKEPACNCWTDRCPEIEASDCPVHYPKPASECDCCCHSTDRQIHSIAYQRNACFIYGCKCKQPTPDVSEEWDYLKSVVSRWRPENYNIVSKLIAYELQAERAKERERCAAEVQLLQDTYKDHWNPHNRIPYMDVQSELDGVRERILNAKQNAQEKP